MMWPRPCTQEEAEFRLELHPECNAHSLYHVPSLSCSHFLNFISSLSVSYFPCQNQVLDDDGMGHTIFSGCEVASHCDFDIHIFSESWCQSSPVLLATCISSLEKSLLDYFAHFFGLWFFVLFCFVFVFLLLSCKSFLYILNTKSLSDIWLVDMFSHSVAYLLILKLGIYICSLFKETS